MLTIKKKIKIIKNNKNNVLDHNIHNIIYNKLSGLEI